MLGDSEAVTTKIVRWRQVLGIERFMLHISVGTLPPKRVLRRHRGAGLRGCPLVEEHLAQ